MTLNGLKYIARVSGFTVFDYSKSYTLLIMLNLYDRACKSKAVSIVDGNLNKMIFIDDSLPQDIQMFALAHEIGHIVLEHSPTENPKFQEDSANDFAKILLKAVECNG